MAKRIIKTKPTETGTMALVVPTAPVNPSSARTGRELLPVPPFSGATIVKTVALNPKSGASRGRFALYEPGMVIDEYVEGCKGLGYTRSKALGDIRFDVARGFITLVDHNN